MMPGRMHHHGRDGSCHPGPGGLFGCARCAADLDEAAAMEAEADAMDDGLIGTVGVTRGGQLFEIRDGKLPWPGAKP
jgi:hypothetical protein